jgi:hypothetical protein
MAEWKDKRTGESVTLLGNFRSGPFQLIQFEGKDPVTWPTDDFVRDYEPAIAPADGSGIDAVPVKQRQNPANPSGPPIIDEVDVERTPAMLALRNVEMKMIEHRGVLDVVEHAIGKARSELADIRNMVVRLVDIFEDGLSLVGGPAPTRTETKPTSSAPPGASSGDPAAGMPRPEEVQQGPEGQAKPDAQK